MATKTSCLPYQLATKVFSKGVPLENNNYIFTSGPSCRNRQKPSAKTATTSQPRCSTESGSGSKHGSMPGSGSGGSQRLWYLAATLAALLCYINSLQGDLVHDDLVAIVRNPDVTRGTPLGQVFEHDFWGRPVWDPASHKSYRPLTILTFRLNYNIGGLNPVGYHIVNVVLHCLATLLFTVTCNDVIFGDRRLAGFAGLLFAVHPVHTEAVAGIVGRADILACVCFLLSFLAYHRCISNKLNTNPVTRWSWMCVSLVLGICAMLCKEQGITVIALCLLYDVFQHLNNKKRIHKEKYCGFVKRIIVSVTLLLGVLPWRVWLMGGHPPVFKKEDNPAAFSDNVIVRLMSHSWVYVCNLWQLLCPITLSYDWQMGSLPLVTSPLDRRNILTLLMILVMGSLLWHMWQGNKSHMGRRTFLGLAFLILPFIPASNIFFTVGFTMAERVLYIPSTGFIILLVHGMQLLRYKLRMAEVNPTALFLALVLLWSCRTVSRNQAWGSRQNLFISGLRTLPHNAKMHYNYANLMRDSGNQQKALHHYYTAIRLWPDYASAHNNLGTLVDNVTISEYHYRQAISIEPHHAGAYFNLANLQHLQGHTTEAINYLQTAITIDPHFPDPYSSLGTILATVGRHEEAEQLHRKFILLQPREPDAHNRLGVFLANQGRLTEAQEHYQKAITIDSRHYISMVNAAKIFVSTNQTDRAMQMFDMALSIDRNSGTLYSAGVFFFNVGETKKAARLFKDLLSQEPDNAEALIHYAQSLAKMGKFQLAENTLLKLLSWQPYHFGGLRELANVYGALKQHHKGIDILKKILHISGDEEVLAMAHFQLGNHFKDAGKAETAFMHYKEAVRLKETIGEAHHNLAVILHLNGSYQDALHHYVRARELLPDNPLVLANMHKLQTAFQDSDYKPVHNQISRITKPNSGISQPSPGNKGGFTGVRTSRSVSQGINKLAVDSPHLGNSLDPGRFVCDSEICQGDVKR